MADAKAGEDCAKGLAAALGVGGFQEGEGEAEVDVCEACFCVFVGVVVGVIVLLVHTLGVAILSR